MWTFLDKYGNKKQAAATATPVAVRVRHSAAQGITSGGTYQTLSFDTDIYNPQGSVMHSTSSNTSRLIAPYTGLYEVFGSVEWPGTPSNWGIRVLKNGTTVLATNEYPNLVRGIVTATVYMAANDYVELQAQQTSGTSPYNIQSISDSTPVFSLIKADGFVPQPIAYPASLVGQEVGYQEITTGVNVTATSSAFASATTVFGPVTFVADGVSRYRFEVAAAEISRGTTYCVFCLYEDGTYFGRIIEVNGTTLIAATGAKYRTPSGGSHTYYVKAYVDGGTGYIAADAGSNYGSSYFVITKAS